VTIVNPITRWFSCLSANVISIRNKSVFSPEIMYVILGISFFVYPLALFGSGKAFCLDLTVSPFFS